MALSMDEQRILAEIEEHFTRSEPALAARLSTLSRPRLADALRSPRTRLLASVAAMATLVIMSVLVYAFISLRGLPQRGFAGRPSASPGHHPVMTVPVARHARTPTAPRASPARVGAHRMS